MHEQVMILEFSHRIAAILTALLWTCKDSKANMGAVSDT